MIELTIVGEEEVHGLQEPGEHVIPRVSDIENLKRVCNFFKDSCQPFYHVAERIV
jgi:hypothetical protein